MRNHSGGVYTTVPEGKKKKNHSHPDTMFISETEVEKKNCKANRAVFRGLPCMVLAQSDTSVAQPKSIIQM